MNIATILQKYTNLGLTDKTSYHSYDIIYPQLWERFLDRKINILEIGTGNGGTLLALSEIFPLANIYGCDHNYDILKISTEDTNIRLLRSMDQCDPSIAQALPILDLIIEDASHDYHKSIRTFENLRSNLNDGALYIIEDVYPQFIELYQNDPRFAIWDGRHIKNRQDDVIAYYENNNSNRPLRY